MSKEIQLTANDFKIRCSAISNITGGNVGMSESEKRNLKEFYAKIKKHEDAGKGGKLTELQQKDFNALLIKEKLKPVLPEGAKTYVRQWVRENIVYKRRKLFGNKYTKKGNDNEEAGRELVGDYLSLGWIPDANENGRKYEEFIEGICDAELKDFIIDIKNSFTFDTFPIFEKTCNKKDYVEQMKGYCYLYKKAFGIIAYVLTDSSEEEILKECDRQKNILGLDEVTGDLYEQVKQTMTYSDLSPHLRVKLFKVQADPKFIEDLEIRVKMCREYAQEVIDEFKEQLKVQKEILK